MKTYTVIRAENRANGREDAIGSVTADTQGQAEMEAAGHFECDDLHCLIVILDDCDDLGLSDYDASE